MYIFALMHPGFYSFLMGKSCYRWTDSQAADLISEFSLMLRIYVSGWDENYVLDMVPISFFTIQSIEEVCV